jgi:RimJ/RimL family protein N-acetyltransferase
MTNPRGATSPLADRVQLRDVEEEDLAIFFEQQLDPQANTMAAFTAKDPTDREAFMAHWAKILADENILIKTIPFDGQVAGSVLSNAWFGKPEVSYWLGREF